MFIGHYAVGLAAKRVVPASSLGTCFLACQLADLVWPTLLLLGVERVEIRPGDTALTPLAFVSYPYSHSLLGMAVLAAVFAALSRRRGSATAGASLLLAAVVLSHWLLDALTHRPDLPVTFSGPTRVGLALWNSVPWTVTVEGLMFVFGIAAYVRVTRSLDRVGSAGFWALIGFLTVVYTANIVGPPPPSTAAVAWAGQLLWGVVAWAYWIDRHREIRDPVKGQIR